MPTINCNDRGWGFQLASLLQKRQKVDLVNVDFDADKGAIQEMARLFHVSFEHDMETKTVRFRTLK
jgi:hypothetical protein